MATKTTGAPDLTRDFARIGVAAMDQTLALVATRDGETSPQVRMLRIIIEMLRQQVQETVAPLEPAADGPDHISNQRRAFRQLYEELAQATGNTEGDVRP